MATGRRDRPSPSARRGRAGGFTLLELILVMVLISVTLALAAPSLRGFAGSRQTADAAMKVVALAEWARSQAIAQGSPCRLNVDPDGLACWLTVQRMGAFYDAPGDWGQPLILPEGVSVLLRAAPGELPGDYVQFYPDGRSDVAALEVNGLQGEQFVVACDSPAEAFRVLSEAEASMP